eukprot:TRINITY_DN11195_c0_g1_i4.p2 TRINITY_DN11195_c0_g1~~TRINITY_DN11195_c0_g1_i4.p2  ORF type:complete len:127 (+),score=22.99 TRINITY_DN11195_c0_g1_i4:492-872(+)
MGMILIDNAYATLIREQDIIISPSDMNVILSTIQSHPAVKKTTTLLPICLPGVSDEGFLYLTIKYSTASVGILYGSLMRESFPECMKAANEVDLVLQQEGIDKVITKHMSDFYTQPYSNGNSLLNG